MMSLYAEEIIWTFAGAFTLLNSLNVSTSWIVLKYDHNFFMAPFLQSIKLCQDLQYDLTS